MIEMKLSSLDKAKNQIKDSESIAIIPSEDFSVDSFSASVGLYNLLLEQNKEVYFVFTPEIPEEVEDLIDEDNIISDIQNRELVVSIDYSGTEAASAHYSTEGDTLEVRIGPIPKDFPKAGRVKAKTTGFEVDSAIFVGDNEINYEFIEGAKVIRINNVEMSHEEGDNDTFLIDTISEKLSHQVFKIASSWGFVPNIRASKALLKGISS